MSSKPAPTPFTHEEDMMILQEYWDTKNRDKVVEAMAGRHTESSIRFRYFQLLRDLDLGGAVKYRRVMDRVRKGEIEMPYDLDAMLKERRQNRGRRPQQEEAFDPVRMRAESGLKESSFPLEEEEKTEERPAISKPIDAPRDFRLPFEDRIEEPERVVEIVYAEGMDDLVKELAKEVRELSETVRSLQDARKESNSFVSFLEAMAKAYRYSEHLDKLDEIVAERDRLREEIQRQKEHYEKQIEEFNQLYKELDDILGHYVRLASVKKVASLGDFIEGIGVLVGKFGEVLDIGTREMGTRGYYERVRAASNS